MLRLGQIAVDLGLPPPTMDVELSGVSIDSRTLKRGEMFVAIRGERDGHLYCDQAIQAGAAALVVSEKKMFPGVAVLSVPDTAVALRRIAQAHRLRHHIPILAITGSNGKTTSKEMCAALFTAHVGAKATLATAGNLNNEYGVPLTLLRLNEQHRYAVVEMGTSGHGEIANLAEMARPTMGLITNAQRAHLQGLQSLDQVAREKGALLQALPPDGVAFLNRDDSFFSFWQKLAPLNTVSFGFDHDAQITASYQVQVLEARVGTRISVRMPNSSHRRDIHLPLLGAHNVRNALGALAVGWHVGIAPELMATTLEQLTPPPGRLERRKGSAGSLVLDDSYNANPDSVKCAIDVLAACPMQRILVLGDMGEIGEAAKEWHSEVGDVARAAHINALLAVGRLSRLAVESFGAGGEHFDSVDELVASLRPRLNAKTVVLVKGSRFMAMERVVNAISEAQHERGTSA